VGSVSQLGIRRFCTKALELIRMKDYQGEREALWGFPYPERQNLSAFARLLVSAKRFDG
jgi:hypothetical protein